MNKLIAPAPAPDPDSDADLKEWALAQIRKPAVTAADYRLRAILNDLLTCWDADRLLAALEVA